jgi:hypothetical protein
MRRILEHYFKFYGGIKPENIIEKFDGKDKMIGSTLLSWVNDGSHFATDDLYMACDPGQIDRYLSVFQRIFELSEHGGHYKMMMGEDYVALPIAAEAQADQIVTEVAAVAATTTSVAPQSQADTVNDALDGSGATSSVIAAKE